MGYYATDKVNARFFGLKLNRETDRDIVELLEAQENVQAFLKLTLRAAAKDGTKMYPPAKLTPKKYGCGICGYELKERGHYCPNCGQAINWGK